MLANEGTPKVKQVTGSHARTQTRPKSEKRHRGRQCEHTEALQETKQNTGGNASTHTGTKSQNKTNGGNASTQKRPKCKKKTPEAILAAKIPQNAKTTVAAAKAAARSAWTRQT